LSDSEFFGEDPNDDPFWAELGNEGASEPEATSEPEAVEPVVAERARDESGRFVAKSDEAAPELSPDPEEAASGAAAEGNDAGTEAASEAPSDASALQAQIAALEKRLADKDDFAGRLSNELGELRKLQEQALEHASRPQVSDWDSLIDDDPARAAQIALQAGDNYRYQQAREAWNDVAPGAPEVFEQNLRLQKQMQELEQRFTQTAEPLAAQQKTQQVATAYSAIREQYPDFDKFEDAMAEVVETRPLVKRNLAAALQSGDAEEQYAVLEDLYLITAGRKSDTLREAQTQAAQSFAEETLKAKQDAVVVSATSTQAEPVQPKTWWDEALADDASRDSGWNVGR
jgi:hypothetical protein